MGIRVGYIETKRELFFKGDTGSGHIVELRKGRDMHSAIKRGIKDYMVDCQAPMMFSPDILLNESCRDEFFFLHPEKIKLITRHENYDDLWYTLNAGKIKKRTFPLVAKCLKILYKSGFTNDNLICFIRKEDGYYHLQIDGGEFGYLDDNTDDADFKNMLAYVFKDIGHTADVVVLPSRGKNLIFTSTIGVYNNKDDFEKAKKSKNISIGASLEYKNVVLDYQNS